jgi:hypothetical protein
MIKTIAVFPCLILSLWAASQSTDTTVYDQVDTAAYFEGGRAGWIKFISQTLNPSVGIDNGAKNGRYNVVIRFTVMSDGTLKDFRPETKYGYGFEEEVVRVLKLSPKWVPAKKNGVSVNSVTRQNQTFIISSG